MRNLSIITCSMGMFSIDREVSLLTDLSRGTSWGGIPFHGVYTSYDYGAPV